MWPFKSTKVPTPTVSPVTDIDMAALPLANGSLSEADAAELKLQIRNAVSKLPFDEQEKFHEMMDRIGHSIRKL